MQFQTVDIIDRLPRMQNTSLNIIFGRYIMKAYIFISLHLDIIFDFNVKML